MEGNCIRLANCNLMEGTHSNVQQSVAALLPTFAIELHQGVLRESCEWYPSASEDATPSI